MRIMRLFDYATSPVGDINAMRADGAFSHSKIKFDCLCIRGRILSTLGQRVWL